MKYFESYIAKYFRIDKFAVIMKSESVSPQERSIINKTTAPLGVIFESNGVLLQCVERSHVSIPQEACSGCFFKDKTCPKSQCSVFGRTDGKNVWFVEVSKEDAI